VIEAHFQLSPQLLEENFGRSLRRWRTQDRTQWAETPLDFPKDWFKSSKHKNNFPLEKGFLAYRISIKNF